MALPARRQAGSGVAASTLRTAVLLPACVLHLGAGCYDRGSCVQSEGARRQAAEGCAAARTERRAVVCAGARAGAAHGRARHRMFVCMSVRVPRFTAVMLKANTRAWVEAS